jgi:hypothetical protein
MKMVFLPRIVKRIDAVDSEKGFIWVKRWYHGNWMVLVGFYATDSEKRDFC